MFEFDPEKSLANLDKHGIDFETAQMLWKDRSRTEVDVMRGIELRTLTTGMIDGKLWTAVYTARDRSIRIISVRRAWEKETRRYGN
jgi:uncharacterized protein